MKRLLLAAYLLAAVTSAAAPIEKNGLVCRTKQQDAELRDWINGLQNAVHTAQVEAKAAKAVNATIPGELAAAEKNVKDLTKERDDAVIAKEHLTAKLHLAKWIFTALATAVIVLLCLWLKIPPPALWFALGGGLAAANAVIWFWV